MPKGFSGIKDIAEQNSPEMWRKIANGSDAKDAPKSQSPNNESLLVDYDSSPSMPGLWQSQDNGMSWICGDYIFVFQYRPCSESLVMQHVLNGEEPIGSLTEPLNSRWKYCHIWVLCVYFQPGAGPKQLNDSIRWPVLIITVETATVSYLNYLFEIHKNKLLSGLDAIPSLNLGGLDYIKRLVSQPPITPADFDSIEGLEPPAICMFLPGGTHINMTTLKALWGIDDYYIYPSRLQRDARLDKVICEFFIEAACNHLGIPDRPKRFGDMYMGFCAVYSDKLTREAKMKVLNKRK